MYMNVHTNTYQRWQENETEMESSMQMIEWERKEYFETGDQE